jgi:hypothetical protein
LDAKLTTLFCKEIFVAKSREVETGWSTSQEWTDLAEPFNEGCGSKMAVWPIMMNIQVLIQ